MLAMGPIGLVSKFIAANRGTAFAGLPQCLRSVLVRLRLHVP